MDAVNLRELKAHAQALYPEPLNWYDSGHGSAYADVDHHVISVLVDPPEGTPHICAIRDGIEYPLETPLDRAYQLALSL